MSALQRVTLYCDGSCLGNPGPGGWAALLVTDIDGTLHEKMLVGSANETTNNRMELNAAIGGLATLKRPCSVVVVTDSNYVVRGMTEWRHNWVKRGWRASTGKAVENRDLWEELIAVASPHTTRWQWVKGHAGHPENERVDEAARTEAERAHRAQTTATRPVRPR